MNVKIRVWPGLVFAFLGVNVAVVATTVTLATANRAAVEPAYYQKAVAWNDTARQLEQNRSLGWRVALREGPGPSDSPSRRPVVMTLTDSQGAPIRGAAVSVLAFHNAHADRRIQTDLVEREAGMYAAPLLVEQPGVHEIRVTAQSGRDRFTAVLAHEFVAPSPDGGPGRGAAR